MIKLTEYAKKGAGKSNCLYKDSKSDRNKLVAELADIITGALIAAANEDIDIEKAFQECQQKNEARAMEGSK